MKNIEFWYLDWTINDEGLDVVMHTVESSHYPENKDFEEAFNIHFNKVNGEYIATNVPHEIANELEMMSNGHLFDDNGISFHTNILTRELIAKLIVFCVQETIGGYRQNPCFEGSWNQCKNYVDENNSNRALAIMPKDACEIDYL